MLQKLAAGAESQRQAALAKPDGIAGAAVASLARQAVLDKLASGADTQAQAALRKGGRPVAPSPLDMQRAARREKLAGAAAQERDAALTKAPLGPEAAIDRQAALLTKLAADAAAARQAALAKPAAPSSDADARTSLLTKLADAAAQARGAALSKPRTAPTASPDASEQAALLAKMATDAARASSAALTKPDTEPQVAEAADAAQRTLIDKLAASASRVRETALGKPARPVARAVADAPTGALIQKLTADAEQERARALEKVVAGADGPTPAGSARLAQRTAQIDKLVRTAAGQREAALRKPPAPAARPVAEDEQASLLAELARSAEEARLEALGKPAAPAARPVAEDEQTALLAKLARSAEEARLGALGKPAGAGSAAELAAEAEQRALFDKLAAGAAAHRDGALRKAPIDLPRVARKTAGLAQTDDEDAAGPVALGYGEQVTGYISPAGETDAYQFTGSTGDVVTISFTSSDIDCYLRLELDGQVIRADDDGGEGLNSLIGSFSLPSSGTYVIRVQDLWASYTGAYALSLSLVDSAPSGDEFVGQVSAGTRTGTLAANRHVYTFTLGNQSDVRIDLTSGSFDTYLRLYAGSTMASRNSDNWIESDDDGGSGVNSMIVRALAAGSYLIEVDSFTGSSSGEYALQLTTTTVNTTDEDAGGAVAIGSGQQRSGRIDPAGDIDDYAFSGSAGDLV
ncbi:MAG: pre-peptidase C-terminal domain-containing protein, partial [Gemmatimonadota bacterium]